MAEGIQIATFPAGGLTNIKHHHLWFVFGFFVFMWCQTYIEGFYFMFWGRPLIQTAGMRGQDMAIFLTEPLSL